MAYASRTLSKAEKRYAQVEKELLAAVWCCEHFKQYLYGAPQFFIQTDHKPLIPLINNRDLDKVPLRCQRLLIRLLRYNVRAEYIPGKQLVLADTLSRAPLTCSSHSPELHQDSNAMISLITSTICSATKAKDIAEGTDSDAVLRQVLQFVVHGWPQQVSDCIKPYFNERMLLSHNDGILYHGFRIVMPKKLQRCTLELIHEGHQGIVKCKARAKSTVWWPGITKEIEDYVTDCNTCARNRYQPPEPLQPTPYPARPWQHVATDLFYWEGKVYIVIVDYFSRYIHASLLGASSSCAVIKALRSVFAVHGILMSYRPIMARVLVAPSLLSTYWVLEFAIEPVALCTLRATARQSVLFKL